MTTRFQRIVPALSLVILLAGDLHAQPLVNIETVTVGDPGNAADSTGYGAVNNVFAIGKYEVTIGQYSTFLNSAASVTSDSYIVDLWNPNMATDLNIAGISSIVSWVLADPYSYSVIGSGNRPITYVSWGDAARFANWMNNGATNGASTETGAYALNGISTASLVRFPKSADAQWWIPNENEWYKFAYNKGGGTNAGYWVYPTQSDTAPGNNIGGATNQANYNNGVYSFTQSADLSTTQNYLTDAGVFSNGPSAYGTFDQGGNVNEWNDAVTFGSVTRQPTLGGTWFADELGLQSSSRVLFTRYFETSYTGFRLATVPEPSTSALLLITAAATLWHLRRRR